MENATTKKIPLGGKNGIGKLVLVDECDAEKLSGIKFHLSPYGYARTRKRENGKITVHMMHHMITGKPPAGLVADHINGNRLDNRRSNLRFCTMGQNNMNVRAYAKNKTGFKGVQPQGLSSYSAAIGYLGKNIHLGTFKDPVSAAIAYNEAAKRYHGEFALLNEIPRRKNKPRPEKSQQKSPD
jgi:hypothetical protein